MEEKRIIFDIKGFVPSKKNNVRHKAGGGGYYDAHTKAEIDGLILQLKPLAKKKGILKPITSQLQVRTDIYTTRSQDTDNMHTTILDCLQKAGIIKNDNQVYKGEYEKIIVKSPNDVGIIIVLLI